MIKMKRREKSEGWMGKQVVASSDFSKDEEYTELKRLYAEIRREYKLTATDIISKFEEKEILIPSCIFNRRLSTFETIVKYL